MKAGIYPNLDNRDYFTSTDWVSASQLKRHLPEWFRPFSGSTASDFGSVFHQRFTGENVPVTVVDEATWTGKAAKEARRAATESGGYSILAGDQKTLDGMEAAVRRHLEASRLVESAGEWEMSVFADVDGIQSKCRFDKLTDDGVAIDLKTTKAGPGAYSLTRAVLDYGYDLQELHYRAVAESAGIELSAFLFVFVQNVPPHHVTVVELDDDFRERASKLRDLALQRLLHPTMVDPYAGATGITELSLPRWAKL